MSIFLHNSCNAAGEAALRCERRISLGVFAFGGISAADMPLRQISIEHFAHFLAQFPVDLRQPLGYIFMYGRFADSEMFGAGAHRFACYQYILCALPHAPFHILPHFAAPPYRRCYILCRIMGFYAAEKFVLLGCAKIRSVPLVPVFIVFSFYRSEIRRIKWCIYPKIYFQNKIFACFFLIIA